MKKIYLQRVGAFTATLFLAMCTLTACQSDDEAPKPVADDELTKSVAATDTSVEFLVSSKSDWKAEVTSDDSEWVYIINPSGKGSGRLSVAIDANYGEEARTATITLTDATGVTEYTISQFMDDANSANDVKYKSTGLGQGLHINQNSGSGLQKVLGLPIANLATMGNDNVKDEIDYVTASNTSKQEFTYQTILDYQNQERLIKANLNVDISYGLFKLGLNGDFKMYGAQNDTTTCYAAIANYPAQNITLDYTSLKENYGTQSVPWHMDCTEEEYRKRRANMFAVTFINIHDAIEQLVANGATLNGSTPQSKQLVDKLNSLDKNYGPVFVTNMIMGGTASIDYSIGSSLSTDTLSIYGKLTTSFSSLFSLKVEASATYFNDVNSFSKNATLNLSISGGSLTAQDELKNALMELTDVNTTFNPKATSAALSTWAGSFAADNMTVTNYDTTCIWDLFSDEAAEILKQYFKAKYTNTINNKGEEVCPYLVNVQELINQY